MSPHEPDNRAYYDDFSGGYEDARGRGYHAMLDELESSLVLPLARGARVLEAGCGTGLILSRVAQVARQTVGVDLSQGMLGKAHERGLDVVQGSVLQLPFADNVFDVTCSFKVLAHIQPIEAAMAELLRVTRPGGHVIAEFYNACSLRYLAKRLAGPQKISKGRTEADVYTRWDTPWSLKQYVPAGAEMLSLYGVRVLTPFAAVHRIPVLGSAVLQAERWAVSSQIRYAGGFLVLVMRKHEHR